MFQLIGACGLALWILGLVVYAGYEIARSGERARKDRERRAETRD